MQQNQNHYDVIVVGAGPTGLMAALEARKTGRKVAVLEKRHDPRRRNADEIRFQGVIVDTATLINLSNVGIDTTKGGFYPISEAVFPRDHSPKPHVVKYHTAPQNLVGESSGSLSNVAFRRKVVAIASISHIENELSGVARETQGIDLVYGINITSIEANANSVTLDYVDKSGTHKLMAESIAIADGAHSDEKGGLSLLGVKKTRLARPVYIVAARIKEQGREGNLIARSVLERGFQHIACFGLKDEVIVYVNVHMDVIDKADMEGLVRSFTAKIGITGDIIGSPLLVKQQAAMVEDGQLPRSVAVLGDAAFSGTAILGVYLNKGICEGVAFGHSLAQGREPPRVRKTDPAYAQIIGEEIILANTVNADWSFLSSSPSGEELFAAVPRCLFRMKVGRHGLSRTLATNMTDVMAAVFEGTSKSMPLPLLKKSSRVAAHFWKALSESLEGSSSK